MARPLSEEKRETILKSAAELVATMGTGAPTAKIAKHAGIAEGTLFTYFATKDELLNQLFLEIEADMAGAMLDGAPFLGGPRERIQSIWSRYIDWGAAHPIERRVIRQLKVSDRITHDSRRKGDELFSDIREVIERDLVNEVRNQSPSYVATILDALAEATQDLIGRDPAQHDHYRREGFEVFWKGITT